MPSPRRKLARNAGPIALVSVTVLYLGLVLVLPLATLLVRTASFGVEALSTLWNSQAAMSGLARSLLLAFFAVAVNGFVGLVGALVLVRQRFVGRRVLDGLVELPLAISPVAVGLAFLLLLGRDGWFSGLLEAVDLRVAFTFPAMVLVTLFVTLPYTLREVVYVLEEQGVSEEEAATTLGATPWQTFWRVTLPRLRYALGCGTLLTAARSLGEFGAVLVVGGDVSGSTQTATTFIYAAIEERDEGSAFAMALVLASVSTALLLANEWLRRRAAGGRT